LYLGDRDVAEELAQETLVRVCEHWKDVQTMVSAEGWTYRVGFNLANSHFRRRAAERRARSRLDSRAELVVVEPDTTSAVALRRAIAELPDAQRRAVLLRFYADLPVAEVAAAMRCPENTVKTHTRRGILALRDMGLFSDELPSEVRHAR
jgi:RNA polymerase sigma-70 factor, ECF subfamily